MKIRFHEKKNIVHESETTQRIWLAFYPRNLVNIEDD